MKKGLAESMESKHTSELDDVAFSIHSWSKYINDNKKTDCLQPVFCCHIMLQERNHLVSR